MYIASQKFINALGNTHTAVQKISAMQAGVETTTLNVVGGTITQSYSDASRWSIDLDFIDPQNRTYATVQPLLDPIRGTTYFIQRGIRFTDGTEEYVPYGIFYPTELDLKSVVGPEFISKGFDGSTRCQDDLATPVSIASGTPITTAIPMILRPKLPSITFDLGGASWTTPTLIMRENIDPWQTAQKMMSLGAMDLVFDRLGVCVSRERSFTVEALADWTFTEGSNATFMDPDRKLGHDSYPNVVVVVGDNPSAPNVVGIAWDNDPRSPTYRYGPYGEHVRTIHSEFVTTSQAATLMAQYWLSKLMGDQDEVSFTCMPNPLLDVGDTVELSCARLGLVKSKMLVARIDLPLDVTQPMTVACQRSVIMDTQGTPVRQ